MGKVICPPNILEEIELGELLSRVIECKHEGLRLAQACAAYAQGKLELSYSFANDETYQLTTLRIITDLDTEVPSITEIIPSAVFYENEMKEMFDVKMQQISLDYDKRLYRIEEDAPLLPQAVKDERRAKAEAAAQAAAAEADSEEEETGEGAQTEEAAGEALQAETEAGKEESR